MKGGELNTTKSLVSVEILLIYESVKAPDDQKCLWGHENIQRRFEV